MLSPYNKRAAMEEIFDLRIKRMSVNKPKKLNNLNLAKVPQTFMRKWLSANLQLPEESLYLKICIFGWIYNYAVF